MPVFKDTAHMYEMLEDLWNHIINETEVGGKMEEFGVSYKFVITQPDGYLYVSHEEVVTGDAANRDAVITMELSGDTVHDFWLKKIKLPVALATKKIKSKGPIPKVLKMLPFLKTVHEKYPEYCEKYGIPL